MKKLMGFSVILSLMAAVSITSALPPPPLNYRISSPTTQLQNEEQVWTCPVDSSVVIAVWRDFRLGYRQIGVGRSTDAGNTWTDSLVSQLRFTFQSDPCLDVDRLGNYYMCFMDWGAQYCSTVLKSSDKGVSWDYPICAGPYGPFLEDKQFITIDRTGGTYDGNLYLAWARLYDNNEKVNVMLVRLQKDGWYFDTPITVAVPPDFSACGYEAAYGGQWAQPLVGSDGALYVNFLGLDTVDCDIYWSIKTAKSTDGGLTISTPEIIRHVYGATYAFIGYVDGGIDVYNSPIGAVDITGGPYDNNIYIAYPNMDSTNTDYYDWNIEFIKSSDGGNTWTEPIFINDDPTGPGAKYDQFHSWLFCNDEGTLITIFYDQRMDTANHYNFDIFAAYSFDGGETFTTNHRITEVSSSPDDCKFGSENPKDGGSKAGKIAEYIGVTAKYDHINAVWTDARNGNQEVWGANWVTPILKPRLIAPINGADITKQYPYFDWAAAWKTADDQYRVEVATDNQFINIAFTEYTDSAGLVSSTYSLPNNLYYWRVKAFKLSTGDSTEYSNTEWFTIGGYSCPDSDGDGFGDPGPYNDCPDDNCPNVFNIAQLDSDLDSIGDLCDNCPDDSNSGQTNSDNDTFGDICDNCPDSTNEDQQNSDSDTHGDVCDNCPMEDNEDQADVDSDGVGDVCDYQCGDCNGDELINIFDITYLIAFMYLSGPTPVDDWAADPNGDSTINIFDITYLITYLYMEGPEPDCI